MIRSAERASPLPCVKGVSRSSQLHATAGFWNGERSDYKGIAVGEIKDYMPGNGKAKQASGKLSRGVLNESFRILGCNSERAP